MNCQIQFSWTYKKNMNNFLSTEYAHRVIEVQYFVSDSIIIFFIIIVHMLPIGFLLLKVSFC